MICRTRILQEIKQQALSLFKPYVASHYLTVLAWQTLLNDEVFKEFCFKKKVFFIDSLALFKQVAPIKTNYNVVAVDGSQIYPDNHMLGLDCFLINIGASFFSYSQESTVAFFSQPTLLTMSYYRKLFDINQITSDIVDLIREEYEFSFLLQEAGVQKNSSDTNFVVLIDGNLVFWYLENKDEIVKHFFLKRYIQSLEQLYQQGVPVAGYLSSSQFSDIILLVQEFIHYMPYEKKKDANLLNALPQDQYLIDTDLLLNLLPLHHRTAIISCNLPIVRYYPDHLKPWFFYLNVGTEIARIEIPAWVAHDEALVDLVAQTCLDQANKGQGYPISLAEAHEQAVVKTVDRDFFYHCVTEIGITMNKKISLSPKSFKKNRMIV